MEVSFGVCVPMGPDHFSTLETLDLNELERVFGNTAYPLFKTISVNGEVILQFLSEGGTVLLESHGEEVKLKTGSGVVSACFDVQGLGIIITLKRYTFS